MQLQSGQLQSEKPRSALWSALTSKQIKDSEVNFTLEQYCVTDDPVALGVVVATSKWV